MSEDVNPSEELEANPASKRAPAEPEPNGELDEVLRFVRDARGFDFTGYKRSSLARRVGRRVRDLGLDSFSQYLDVLEADVDEFSKLFNTVLINVTGFFRDPATWEFLSEQLLPPLIERHRPDRPIRVWSAGCASGEEAYTLAMLIAEQLDTTEVSQMLKIYGTDVDLEALDHARRGAYPETTLAAVPEDLRHKYFQFDERGRGFVVTPELRRTVVFGRHDLTHDPPISNLDLVACRNTLMYLNAETQAVVVPRLHYALVEGGYLILGKAELIVHGGTGRFSPTSLPQRIFVALPGRRRASTPGAVAAEEVGFSLEPFDRPPAEERRWASMLDAVFDTAALAQLIVDPNGVLIAANEAARDLLGVGGDQVGRPLRDLRISFDPVELQRPIERALVDGISQELGTVHARAADGRDAEIEVRVLRLINGTGDAVGVSVTYADVTRIAELRSEFRQLNEALETAYEELQSTNEELVTGNEELQSTNEELETTNEELQSTNEELETTNEELRSSNEELETSNEELQSAHHSVEVINKTLREVNSELNRRGSLHRRMTDGLPFAIVMLDPQLLVEEWNAAAAELWGLRSDEAIGQPFFGLDIGLPIGTLQQPVRDCVATGDPQSDIEIEAVNRRGRRFACKVSVMAIVDEQTEGPAALLIMRESVGST